MAIMEHDRWMQSKDEANWTYGPPPRDDGTKLHPNLIPWEKLPDEEEGKDRQAMKNIPKLLGEIGFEVYSLVPEESRKPKDQQDNGDQKED